MKIRLLLADDHPALLAGVMHELKAVPTLEIVDTAHDADSLVQKLQLTACDVLVTDYSMPRGRQGDGLTLLSYVRRNYPGLRIVVFTNLDNPGLVQELARLGVQSVLSKTFHVNYLVSAVHAVYAGSTYFPDVPVDQRPGRRLQGNGSKSALTKRELEVVRLYVSGMSINEIAEKLHRSKQTISTQKSSAMRKLGIVRDADLFRYAYETGIIVGAQSA